MKKIIIINFIWLSILFFNGCSIKGPLIDSFEIKDKVYPSNNKLHKKYTGEKIYSYENYTSTGYPIAILTNNLNDTCGLGQKIKAPSGSEFLKYKENNEIIYCSKDPLCIDIVFGPWSAICLKDIDNDYQFDKFKRGDDFYFTNLKSKIPYRLSKKFIQESFDGIRQELIYNGYSNNTLYIQYREFINNLAKPSFYQELKYQYNKKPITIRYKNIKLKIIKADNNSIIYKLLNYK